MLPALISDWTGFPWPVLLFLIVVGITMGLIIRDEKRAKAKCATLTDLLNLEEKINLKLRFLHREIKEKRP